VPAPEAIRLYTPYNNRECLHYHQGARSFEESPIHSAMRDDLVSNQTSCLTGGCHETVRSVANLGKVKPWKRGTMTSSPVMERRVRISAALVFLGLTVELTALRWAHPTALLVFALAAIPLVGEQALLSSSIPSYRRRSRRHANSGLD
jgi:hypothetical protein